MRGRILKLGEFARLLGRRDATLRFWIDQGMPVVTAGSRGRSFELNSALAVDWLLKTQARGSMNTEELNKARITAARAEREELELAKLRGKLLPADEVARATEAIWLALRDSLLTLPAAIADQLCDCAADGPAAVDAFLRERIEQILLDASNLEFEMVDDDTSPDVVAAAP